MKTQPEHLQVHILTIFPNMFESPFREGLVRRAVELGRATITTHNLRDFTADRHRTTDDYGYGGGKGMVMKPEPIFAAVEAILGVGEPYTYDAETAGQRIVDSEDARIILLTPQGRLFDQQLAEDLAQRSKLVVICGRYEGVDDRVAEHLATDEISFGDYILGGGEVLAMALTEAVCRLLPGVLDEEALWEESYVAGLLEYPQYTRPAAFRGWSVPAILLSGDHAAIARWRRLQSLLRTRARRPDLWQKLQLTQEDLQLLAEAEG
ncbi:MAG: tRNA (guanosine(37)-N1)-methyltransferase TrmD [Chloroflexi bacterium]|nr:tRNA (guanosine(37)-N1)-methyltransferase TrmD [Chloroflexota bacterium]